MSQVSAVLRKVDGGYAHWCPGCKEMHTIAVEKPNFCGARWVFDGEIGTPTFTPSVNISTAADPEYGMPEERCHYFITKGNILFLKDCTHALAAQTVPLPHLPANPTKKENE